MSCELNLGSIGIEHSVFLNCSSLDEAQKTVTDPLSKASSVNIANGQKAQGFPTCSSVCLFNVFHFCSSDLIQKKVKNNTLGTFHQHTQSGEYAAVYNSHMILPCVCN